MIASSHALMIFMIRRWTPQHDLSHQDAQENLSEHGPLSRIEIGRSPERLTANIRHSWLDRNELFGNVDSLSGTEKRLIFGVADNDE
ncbi:hypothetical protein JTB14_029157 [Gonioctena quinquepunctata]|nr:hypothetical protein JTB14_029157 [Gonioctena quinquepunctata]